MLKTHCFPEFEDALLLQFHEFLRLYLGIMPLSFFSVLSPRTYICCFFSYILLVFESPSSFHMSYLFVLNSG